MFTGIFIGRSGCGKGTQAKLLIERLKRERGLENLFYLESGERFREFVSQGNYTARLSREIMKTGSLQPAFLAIHIWAHFLIDQMDEGKSLIIDGTPRLLEEAKILDQAFKFYKRGHVNVVYLNVSPDWAIQRLKERSRADDKTEDQIDRRMSWFDESVLPVIDYYRTNPDYKFLDINGERPIDEIHQEIIRNISIA